MIAVSADGSRSKIGLEVAADPLEEPRARRHAVLHHLVEPRAEFAPRQRAQHGRIDDHAVRLIERSDQILAERMVDADLAADGAVHLREQRRRDVHERDAAQVGRGREPGHVADDAAAERHERRTAIGLGLDQRVVHAGDRRELFEPFAVGNQNRLHAACPARHARAVEPPHRRARHHETARRNLELVEQPPDPIEGAVVDRDRVRARGSGDVDADRGHEDRMVG